MLTDIFVDFETDGLDTSTCQITQAAVLDSNGKVLFAKCFGVTLDCFQPLEVTLKALEYSRYPLEYAKYLPPISAGDLRSLLSFFDSSQFIWAHNAAFDLEVFKTACRRADVFRQEYKTHWSCTMALACEGTDRTRLKLPTLAVGSTPHDATSDANNCRLLWHKVRGTGPYKKELELNLNF
jgi:DNA polymerase III epsilon subunit-like protein